MRTLGPPAWRSLAPEHGSDPSLPPLRSPRGATSCAVIALWWLSAIVGCRGVAEPVVRPVPLEARRPIPDVPGDPALTTASTASPWAPPYEILWPIDRPAAGPRGVTVTWSYDPKGAPFPPEEVIPVIEEIEREWERTGVVRFERGDTAAAAAAGRPAIEIGWRRGDHAGCPPFLGWDGGLAHATDPSYRGVGFVHLNAGFRWTLAEDPPPERPRPGPSGISLRRPTVTHFRTVLLHELGHNLGLGHARDPDSIMSELYAADGTGAQTRVRAPRITGSDAAGIHTLYGGGVASEGDIEILAVTAEGTLVPLAPTLRRIAPPELIQWDAFDADGDGRDEVVLWPRTGSETAIALGAAGVTLVHCDDQAWVERVEGPMIGMLDPRRPPLVRAGTALSDPGALGIRRDDGSLSVLRFEPDGLPLGVVVDPGFAADEWREGGSPSARSLGDLDGDGRPERLTRLEEGEAAPSSIATFLVGSERGEALATFRARAARVADLDGDGVLELLVEGRAP